MKTLSVIIPFLNEEKTIIQILEKLNSIQNNKFNLEIILINDGSVDQSEKLIQEYLPISRYKISYFSNKANFGKGYSVKQGFKHASGDFFVIQDADLEYNPEDLINLLYKLENEGLDFIYGSRTRGYIKFGFQYSYFSFLFGGLLISLVTSIVSLKIISDEPTCYKLFKKELLPKLLTPKENNFDWEPAITILLLKLGYKYGEVPIRYYPRKNSEGKKIKFKDGISAIKTIIKWRFFDYK